VAENWVIGLRSTGPPLSWRTSALSGEKRCQGAAAEAGPFRIRAGDRLRGVVVADEPKVVAEETPANPVALRPANGRATGGKTTAGNVFRLPPDPRRSDPRNPGDRHATEALQGIQSSGVGGRVVAELHGRGKKKEHASRCPRFNGSIRRRAARSTPHRERGRRGGSWCPPPKVHPGLPKRPPCSESQAAGSWKRAGGAAVGVRVARA